MDAPGAGQGGKIAEMELMEGQINSRTLILAVHRAPSLKQWEVLARLQYNASRWVNKVDIAIQVLKAPK